MEPFEIRPIFPDGLGDVLEIYRLCEDFLALGPDPHASVEMVERDYNGAQQAGRSYCGIYLEQNRLVGVLDYLPCGFEGDPRQAFIELLMIAKPFRRRGLGQALVAWVEQVICQNAQVQSILLGVQVNNPDALRFWQRCGYAIARGAELQPDGTTSYLMRKPV
jgi:ribosomal protein S18 acetylase RimI-like enzyme